MNTSAAFLYLAKFVIWRCELLTPVQKLATQELCWKLSVHPSYTASTLNATPLRWARSLLRIVLCDIIFSLTYLNNFAQNQTQKPVWLTSSFFNWLTVVGRVFIFIWVLEQGSFRALLSLLRRALRKISRSKGKNNVGGSMLDGKVLLCWG